MIFPTHIASVYHPVFRLFDGGFPLHIHTHLRRPIQNDCAKLMFQWHLLRLEIPFFGGIERKGNPARESLNLFHLAFLRVQRAFDR